MTRLRTLFLVIALPFIVNMAAGTARAGVPDDWSVSLASFDFEQRIFAEVGFEIKDHCILPVETADGTLYHLFYLRGVLGSPAISIGHAISLDLAHWKIEPPVLYVEPNTWDDMALWAPQVIEISPGNYIMYYTGVNTFWAQQAGAAVSTDLYNWIKVPGAVYRPDTVWALWSDDTWSHGRDPFVFKNEGTHYMLNTAKTWWNRGAISLASSTDFLNWQDLGPLYENDTWHVMESVQLIEEANKYHLFFTEETVLGVTHMTSDSLFSGWDPNTKHIIDPGHAPEVNEFDPGRYLFSRHTTHQYGDGTAEFVIRLDSLLWFDDFPVVYKPWPLASNWNLVWGTAFISQPTFFNNPAARGDSIDVGYEGMSWISSYEQYSGPLGIGEPGDTQGDEATGCIHSKVFTLAGRSINLLVGGGNYPNQCYVALVDANTQQILFKETGKNTDEMDLRTWSLAGLRGRKVYVEILDNSTAPFGHISVDDIQETTLRVAKVSEGAEDGNKVDVASRVVLFQNTPNPFNPTTTIAYYLPEGGHVAVEIFDVSGQRIRQLHSRTEESGSHAVTWDGKNSHGESLSTGVYFYRLSVDGNVTQTKKMMLLK